MKYRAVEKMRLKMQQEEGSEWDTLMQTLEKRVWTTLIENPLTGSHWVDFLAGESSAVVLVENPEYTDGSLLRRIITPRLALRGYLTALAEGATHCGGYDLLNEPDACFGDVVFQYTLFGKVVYA
jgi:hypothetical protein